MLTIPKINCIKLIRNKTSRKVKLTWTVKAKRAEEKHLNYNNSQALFKELSSRLDKGMGYLYWGWVYPLVCIL
ncbi:hypothetical protein NCCP2331_35180 [Sporosarcina sp. NCCP-2331]|nr:hypothetical protein NCCP2331_35180 [Sporosarcina sp. NCCP-2331]GLB57721.1 hypothetical protein NCCP2378_35110 [Sporosarcina sp. NCCP-2378]